MAPQITKPWPRGTWIFGKNRLQNSPKTRSSSRTPPPRGRVRLRSWCRALPPPCGKTHRKPIAITSQNRPAPPPRRQGPETLALHMALEGWILQTSFTGVMPLSGVSPLSNQTRGVSPLSNQSLPNPAQVVAALATGGNPDTANVTWTDHLEPVSFLGAVVRQARVRLETFVAGVNAYQVHPYRRALQLPPPVWRHGSATLVEYGGPRTGLPVLFLPSLNQPGLHPRSG